MVQKSQDKSLSFFGLASALEKYKPSQSCHEAVAKAKLGSAYLGWAWAGLWPEARPKQHYSLGCFLVNEWLVLVSQDIPRRYLLHSLPNNLMGDYHQWLELCY